MGQTQKQKSKVLREKNTICPHTVSANLFILFLFGVFPLLYHNNYIDIQTFKAQAFRTAAGLYLGIEAVLTVIGMLQSRAVSHARCVRISTKKQGITAVYFLTGCTLLLMCGVTLSMLCSRWPQFAWIGRFGREVGTVDYLLGGGICLVLAHRFRPHRYLPEAIALCQIPVFLLIILNARGIDPLGMYTNLVPSQHKQFIGTLGNLNTASAWLCLSVPAFAAGVVLFRTVSRRLLFGVAALLGIVAGLSVRSDSFYLGCVGAALVLLAGYVRMHRNVWVSAVLLVLLSILGVLTVAVILVNLHPANAETLWGRYLSVFILRDSFGSGRGYVWHRTIEMWHTYSPREKLFGCGTDCFYQQMMPVYGREMTKLFGAPFADAHCEFLHLLLTTGLVGTAGYFGLLIGTLFAVLRCMRKRFFDSDPAAASTWEGSTVLMMCAAALGGYLAQGLVNAPFSACVPALFGILGVSRHCSGTLLLNKSL